MNTLNHRPVELLKRRDKEEVKELLPRATIYYNNYGDFMDLIKECFNQGFNLNTLGVTELWKVM